MLKNVENADDAFLLLMFFLVFFYNANRRPDQNVWMRAEWQESQL